MTGQDTKVSLFEDEIIKSKILKAWEDVFKASGNVIRDSGLYGFDGMELIPNPNIHQMMKSLKVVAVILADISENLDKIDFDAEQIRLVINAQEQIRRMERAATGLLIEDRGMFEAAIAELDGQACF